MPIVSDPELRKDRVLGFGSPVVCHMATPHQMRMRSEKQRVATLRGPFNEEWCCKIPGRPWTTFTPTVSLFSENESVATVVLGPTASGTAHSLSKWWAVYHINTARA